LVIEYWDFIVIWCLEFDIFQCSITPEHLGKSGVYRFNRYPF